MAGLKFPGDGVRIDETDVSIAVRLRSNSNLSSSGATALTNSSMTATYWRAGGTPTPVVLSPLDAITSAHSDGGFIEASQASMFGVYRFDVPDAAFVNGADWVLIDLETPSTYGFASKFPLVSDGVLRPAFAPQTVSAYSITLDAGASSSSSAYKAGVVEIVAIATNGDTSDRGKTAFVTGYAGTGKIATLANGWEGGVPTTSAASLTCVLYSAPPIMKSMWRAFDNFSTNTGTLLYENGDTAVQLVLSRSATTLNVLDSGTV